MGHQRDRNQKPITKLFEMTEERTKQINKEFRKLTEDTSKQILDQINKMISEFREDTK